MHCMMNPQIVFQACVCIVVGTNHIIIHRGWTELDLDGMMDQHGSEPIVGFPKPKCLVTFYCGMLWSELNISLNKGVPLPLLLPLYIGPTLS